MNHRHIRRAAVAGAISTAVALGSAATAAAAPTGVYADFQYCPTGNTAVVSCLVSDTTSGAIKLGNQNVPITKRIRLQGGIVQDQETFEITFVPATGGRSLDAPALDVPGGLAGITVPSQLPQPARGLLEAAIKTANGVTAQAQLVGTPKIDTGALANEDGTAVSLPLRIKLNNPFLGDNCYVGSAASPVTLQLTTGFTAPPAGTAPIKGSSGTLDGTADISILRGVSLVDNVFTVPGASGCGGLLSALVNPVVNLKVGLPAKSGKSVARLNGDIKLAPRQSVVNSDR